MITISILKLNILHVSVIRGIEGRNPEVRKNALSSRGRQLLYLNNVLEGMNLY